MSLQFVIQFGGNPSNKKIFTFKFTFLVLPSLIINVPFCHEDSDRERCKGEGYILLFHISQFLQSGNKTARFVKLCIVRDLVSSARKGFMNIVHKRPWCQD